jgi:hypothetical protein
MNFIKKIEASLNKAIAANKNYFTVGEGDGIIVVFRAPAREIRHVPNETEVIFRVPYWVCQQLHDDVSAEDTEKPIQAMFVVTAMDYGFKAYEVNTCIVHAGGDTELIMNPVMQLQ